MSLPIRMLAVLFLFGAFAGTNLSAQEPIESQGAAEPALSFSQAVILGVVEGATEYLPVSSTGHLVIAEHLMGMHGDKQKKQAADSLAICIQAGAILAVLMLYFGRIREIVAGMLGRSPEGLQLLRNLIVAFLPAAVAGFLFKDLIKEHLLRVLPVATAIFVGGVLILWQSWGRKPADDDVGKELSQMCWRAALFIGIVQCLALWPGFSRSFAAILGGCWARFRMMAAVEFSFLLGLVTLSAATAYEGLKHGKEMIALFGWEMPLVSLVIAFVAAVISVRFMVGMLGKFGLAPFGYYRILLAFLCLWWL